MIPHLEVFCLPLVFISLLSSPHIWLVDSGATRHIYSHRSLFTSLIPVDNAHVSLPNGSRVSIHFVGSVSLISSLTLHNIFFIPEFRVNLLSVSTLLHDTSISLMFYDYSFVIQDKLSLQMIGKGELQGGLYVLQVPHQSPTNGVIHHIHDAFSLFLMLFL